MDDDRDFFDNLVQLWAKTTGAQDTYWRPESTENGFTIYAEGRDGARTVVASGLSERDADWICAMHGCMPDVHRRLHMALDEADRADRRFDEQQHLLAGLTE